MQRENTNQPTEQQRLFKLNLKPQNLKRPQQGLTGFVYSSLGTYEKFLNVNNQKTPVYVNIGGYIFILEKSNDFADDEIALNKPSRQVLRIALTQPILVQQYQLPVDREYRLSLVQLEIELLQSATQEKLNVDDKEFKDKFKVTYKQQFLKIGQILLMDLSNSIFQIKVNNIELLELGVKNQTQVGQEGMITDDTDFELTAKFSQSFKLKSTGDKTQNLFRKDFKFEDLGIGGLNAELGDIFRRAFASRRFPPNVLAKYGITHVKGLLLHGPPGTGKTLIARQLAKVLKAKEPKIVNGPEILSKFVGESEENVRKLFKDAKDDSLQYGEDSQLHIIVFDEIDAICKQRGTSTSGTGVQDSVVNQLLSMIDGVDALNNILVIGMTNRKDMLDEAILRPGRFEVHIEVGLPNESGRQDILKIHTKTMNSNGVMGKDVNLAQLAKITKNYTGAELEAVVKSASAWAFNRVHNIMDFTKDVLKDEVVVGMQDFQNALTEVKPQFGVDNDKFEVLLRNQLIDYGPRFQKIQNLLKDSIEQSKSGESSQLHSILLEGEVGTGKTAIAAWAGLSCEFPFVKLISPDNFVGYTETGKINAMVKIFDDAYRSPLSCVVLDNIERLIEFIDMGPRFSNSILQALLVLVKRTPKKDDHRILIIGTTNQAQILKQLEITQCFNMNIKVPVLSETEEVLVILNKYQVNKDDKIKIAEYGRGTAVKKLLMILDMVNTRVKNQQTGQGIRFADFQEVFDAINEQ